MRMSKNARRKLQKQENARRVQEEAQRVQEEAEAQRVQEEAEPRSQRRVNVCQCYASVWLADMRAEEGLHSEALLLYQGARIVYNNASRDDTVFCTAVAPLLEQCKSFHGSASSIGTTMQALPDKFQAQHPADCNSSVSLGLSLASAAQMLLRLGKNASLWPVRLLRQALMDGGHEFPIPVSDFSESDIAVVYSQCNTVLPPRTASTSSSSPTASRTTATTTTSG